MLRVKSLLATMIVAGVTWVVGTASAIGTTESTSKAVTFNAGNAAFGNVTGATFSSFAGDFTFSVPTANSASAGGVAVSGMTMPLFTGTVGLSTKDIYAGAAGSGALLATGTFGSLPSGIKFASLSANNLGAGNYYQEAAGSLANPKASDSYGGAPALQSQPVPASGEWAMMISGLAMFGVIVRRRSGPAL